MIARTDSTKANAGLGPGVLRASITKHNPDAATAHDNAKAFSTWQARFAMHRHSLYQVKTGNDAMAFLVTRWGMVRELANLDEVAKLFALIGCKL